MMGCVFDGYAEHMKDYNAERTFQPLEKESTREQIIEELKRVRRGDHGELSAGRF